VVAGAGGEYTGWQVIGAEATSTGFEVAWHNTTSDQYTIWYTDSTGNFVSNPTGAIAGTSATLKSFETSFQQDLNGDGAVANTPIASAAAMTLASPAAGFDFRPDLGAGQPAVDTLAHSNALANSLAAPVDANHVEHAVATGGQDAGNPAVTAFATHLDHFLFV
jgi:hypothetical protein